MIRITGSAFIALTLLVIMALAPVESSAISPTWVNIDVPGVSTNPNSPSQNFGYVSVAVDTAGTVYVGTVTQGIWKSLNQGATWSKADTGSGSNLVDAGSNWTMATDPFHPGTLYTTSAQPGGEHGVLKSVDYGSTWTDVLPPNNPTALSIATNDVYGISVDPYTANHLLVSFHYYWHNNQDAGILESIDGGTTWIVHNPVAGWGNGEGAWFGGNSTTWIVGSQNNGVWVTTNSGASWTQVSGAATSHGGQNGYYRDANSGYLFITDGTGVLRSVDGGITWTNISNGLSYAYYDGIVGDGTSLYINPSFPVLGNNGPSNSPWMTLPIALGTTTWQAYPSSTSPQTACDANTGLCNGPNASAFDPVQTVMYTSNWDGGLWKLQTGSGTKPIATNTPTSTATPTATSLPTNTPIATPTPNCFVEAIFNGTPTTFSRPASFCTNQ